VEEKSKEKEKREKSRQVMADRVVLTMSAELHIDQDGGNLGTVFIQIERDLEEKEELDNIYKLAPTRKRLSLLDCGKC